MTYEQYDLEEEKETDLLEIVQLLVRRKLSLSAWLPPLGRYCYTLTLPNTYCSVAKVLPPQKEGPGGLSALLGQGGAGGLGAMAAGLTGGTDLFIGIMKSRTVVDAVIKRLDLVRAYGSGSQQMTRDLLAGRSRRRPGLTASSP